MVVVPEDSPAEWQEFHQKVELEKACLEEAGHQFMQAKNTPLLTQPLIDIFGEHRNLKVLGLPHMHLCKLNLTEPVWVSESN